MPIIRAKHDRDFYIALNSTVDDPRLSYKARGVLAYLLSKPDDWKVIVADLVKHSTDGERAIRAGLAELMQHGYANRKSVRDDKHRIIEWEYTIHETPLSENQEVDNEPLCGFSNLDNEPIPKPPEQIAAQEFEEKRRLALAKLSGM